ncbi:TonB-dependent receptor [Prevotella melaninogenica]|uniref:TonB-dependent receptor n=1 Tax=Prevotella melaninogenica TaxID=28132 RepID=UPI0021508284|nr:TonB-dependent receptor [Prevotella melaninogenica]
MKKKILTLLMSGCYGILAAQTTGTVVDENKQPLPAATVSLFRESENKMISGVVTDMNGGFELNTHEGENYRIRISFVGYSTQEIKCQNISKHLSVGTIVLEPESKQLNDVTVTANNVIQKADRQIIIPNLLQQKTSSNGLSLLQHLQLSRISVNTLDSKVTTTMGDAVELRINGVKAEIQEVKALLPADVLRIEYHDNPGLRYGNVAAVIDIILKEKKNGGSISGELMNTINPLGIGDYQLSGNYHVGKSNFKTSINWNRRDVNWLRENMEAFNATTPSINNYEIGQKTKARYDNINLSIGYDYINSGNILSVTFRDLYNNTPHAVFDRNSKLIQNSNTFDIMDRTKSKSNNPSLDIYYQHEFTKDKHLFFDLIGTYINTKNDRLYRQSQGNSVQEISSHVDGNKYSAIAEVIYEQKIKDSRLSFGLRHQQMYTKNAYDGNTSSSVKMNTGESYGFGEWASKLGKLDYMVGVGAMRTYVSQGNAKQVKYIFRPTIQLGYRFNNYLSIRYKAYMGGYAPSLAELSDVEQHIDIYQIRRGNPNLQAVRFFSNELSISVGTKYISAEWFTRYSYDDKPYMEETTYSNGFYVRSYANQRDFHRLNSQINLKVQPWKDYMSIQLTPFVNRYISNGNTYTHTHTNWGLRANLMGMYKNWYVGANLETSFHSLWGETLNKDEKSHSIVFGYNREKWGVELQLQNIFSSRYEMSVENLSHLAPYNQMVWSKNLCKVFGIDFHFNLNFGKHGSEVNQRIHNSDTDAGIVPTTK